MRSRRHVYPMAFVAGGLLGISLFLVASRSGWPIVPASDFAKGLWFGACIGLEMIGMLWVVRAKKNRAIG